MTATTTTMTPERRARRDDAIRAMRARGMTLAKIGAVFGLTRQRVGQITDDRGPPPVVVGFVRENWDRMLAQEIAEHLGVGPPTVSRWARALGLPKKRPGPRKIEP